MTASSWPGFPNLNIPDADPPRNPAPPPRRRPSRRSIAWFVLTVALVAVVTWAMWVGFIFLLSLIAGVTLTFWQAFAIAWLCIAVAQTANRGVIRL